MIEAQDADLLSEKLLDLAKKAGADAADVLVVAGNSVSIETMNGKLEHAERSESVDMGLRVLIGQKQAIIGSSTTNDTALAQMAERAIAMAKVAPDDPHVGLADPSEFAQSWDAEVLDLVDTAPAPTSEDLLEHSIAAEQAGRQVKGVAKIETAGASHSASHIRLRGTNGFNGGYARSEWSLGCVAIAGEGLTMEQDYYGDSRSHRADLCTPEYAGRRAGERAVERFGATRPPTGTYPVLFDERISSSLMGHLVSAINGAAIARGSSWLKDALGERVLPEGLDLVEDPHRPRVGGSRPFDAEGLAVGRRKIVDDGVLTGWTLDLASARKLGLKSTGNASRGTTSPPSPSVGNLELTQRGASRDDLIKDMGTGLIVTSMIGSTINPTTGDYSRGAAGFWVENGQISHPVNECTIAGNLRDMLGRILPANDARAHLSRVIPSLLVEGMTIAGT